MHPPFHGVRADESREAGIGGAVADQVGAEVGQVPGLPREVTERGTILHPMRRCQSAARHGSGRECARKAEYGRGVGPRDVCLGAPLPGEEVEQARLPAVDAALEQGVPVRTLSPAANGDDQSSDLVGWGSSGVFVASASARRPPLSSGT